MKRKMYTFKLKAKVAVAAIKGDHTAKEIASEFGIHVSQVNCDGLVKSTTHITI